MDYSTWGRDKLVERITELEGFVRELVHHHEQEHPLHQAWGEDLCHYYWNMARKTVLIDPARAPLFGIDPLIADGDLGEDLFVSRIHPEDVALTQAHRAALRDGSVSRIETEYRMLSGDGTWRWFNDRAVVTRHAADGSPVIVSGLLFDTTRRKVIEEQLAEKNRQLLERAERDGLTGISNRRTIGECLDYELAAAELSEEPVSIVIFDIDYFKQVNDTHGHLAGDDVLRDFGQILSELVRAGDTVGRYGGEEFLAIMPGTDVARAAIMAERARARVEEHVFSRGIRLTVCAGVAEARGGSAVDLIEQADARLYAAKRGGRNRVIAEELVSAAGD